jgi:endo-1,4-beta-xylanase
MKKNLNNPNEKTSRLFSRAIIRTCLVICLMLTVSLVFGQMAAGKSKWVGNIWYGGSEPLKFSTYWNQLTPENAGKWASVEGSRDVMNWSQVDAMYNYCKSKGYPFKEHCFVWGAQQPPWLNNLSASEQAGEVEEWIRLYGERYPDTDYIDVVNEMFHNTPVYKEALGGNGSTGWDWIVKAFQWARQYCPKAKLLINEYNVIEGWTAVSDYANLANILKSRGLIDGIGIQCHGLETTSLTDVTNRLNQLGSSTGLPLYVSELDLVLSDENAQATRYSQLFPVLYENQNVAGITLWGYIEGHHWRDNAWILHADGTERPALTWIKNYLGTAPTGEPTTAPSTVPTIAPTAAPGCSLKGDVNGNGSIDIVDALLIAQSYVGLNPSGFNALCADVNCSGAIDIVDALLIAQLYVGLISSFPC